MKIPQLDQVWCADITSIGPPEGFAYLVAIMDWFSRYLLAWEVSNLMEGAFCLSALDRALSRRRRPEIRNTDQGSQFTCAEWLSLLEGRGIRLSMDGRGRAFDNMMIERLWRTVKWEHVCVRDYRPIGALRAGFGE